VVEADKDSVKRAEILQILKLLRETLCENPSTGKCRTYFSDSIVVSTDRNQFVDGASSPPAPNAPNRPGTEIRRAGGPARRQRQHRRQARWAPPLSPRPGARSTHTAVVSYLSLRTMAACSPQPTRVE
jgi:hypothetical protein